jgi:hypothetical protein
MFKTNSSHKQEDFFSSVNLLPEEKRQKLEASAQWSFYNIVFCNINESLFSDLYSEKASRPNAPINVMVGSLILKHHFGWSFEQLFNHIDFDLLTRAALGLNTLSYTPFVPSTIFDFQRRVFEYHLATGHNLFEQVFDAMTKDQLTELGLKTSIQRADSVLIASNIRDYSRLQLIIEVLLRVYRILSDEDKERVKELLAPYLKHTSSQYCYRLERDAVPHELSQLGAMYHALIQQLRPVYGDSDIFSVFERVYTEHFSVAENTVTLIPAAELSGNILQSPDDPDATYRVKRGESSKGYALNVVETAHPDNPMNLVVDVCIESNTTDDSVILNKRLEKITATTPDLDELHTDGSYGSDANDKALEEAGIQHVQTAVRGRKAAVEMNFEATGEQQWDVSCPNQTVKSEPTKKRFKASFNMDICGTCPLAENCQAQKQKRCRCLYFTPEDVARNARHRSIWQIPPERRTLRSNVEATIREFVHRLNNHTVSVRGRCKTAFFAFQRAASINFGRIFRYQCALDTQKDV